jgi:putative ABC transport system permease protein
LKLAIANLLHDRIRFLVATAGIAFAIFLIAFQASLLNGFLAASSKIIDATDGDLWIVARGVPCFDFSATLPRRFLEMIRGADGIASVSRMSMAFVEFRKTGGRHQVVALVGADPEVGSRFPVPHIAGQPNAILPDSVLVDHSTRELLSVDQLPLNVEINGRRARVTGEIEGFSSFLGSPYVFTSYREATRYMKMGPEDAMYLVARTAPGRSIEEVKAGIQAHFPEVDVWTRAEFADRARRYWLSQTGAGGSIISAALLGFIIGLLVVSQTIYAATMDNIEEFATLSALGASRRYITTVVLVQALIVGAIGCLAGWLGALPVIRQATALIAWIQAPWWLPLAVFPAGLAMCALASIISVRRALTVDPGQVFRA